MTDAELQQQMRADWDRRAREDAHYYVAFGRRGQDPAEFFASAAQALHAIQFELHRLPASVNPQSLAALEIGCGPGRLLVPLSRVFGQVAGVDVSPEMIARARENLAGIPNARAELASGADLGAFADDSFDFCYSYAVFQHIPDRDVVWNYLREARRVLRPGGLLKCQFNAVPETDRREADTWSGSRFQAEELRQFCRDCDWQLLLLEGAATQNLWMTARKQSAGWWRALQPVTGAHLVKVTNTYTADLVVPAAGRFSSASLWVENLTLEADLNSLEVEIAGRRAAPCYIGGFPEKNLTQVNVFLPPGTPTGLLSARLWMLGQPVSNSALIRVIPPAPPIPRVVSVTDGINLLSRWRVETGTLRVDLEEVGRPAKGDIHAELDGRLLEDLELCCVDPLPERYTFNGKVPPGIPPGPHWLTVRLRGRALPPVAVEIAG